MKTSEEQRLEEGLAILQERSRKQNYAALGMALPMALGFLIATVYPSVPGSLAVGFGAAVGITIGVSMIPDSFRSRGGSLTLAFSLVAAMWLMAFVVAALILLG